MPHHHLSRFPPVPPRGSPETALRAPLLPPLSCHSPRWPLSVHLAGAPPSNLPSSTESQPCLPETGRGHMMCHMPASRGSLFSRGRFRVPSPRRTCSISSPSDLTSVPHLLTLRALRPLHMSASAHPGFPARQWSLQESSPARQHAPQGTEHVPPPGTIDLCSPKEAGDRPYCMCGLEDERRNNYLQKGRKVRMGLGRNSKNGQERKLTMIWCKKKKNQKTAFPPKQVREKSGR